MHLFTLTAHSNLFGHLEDDEKEAAAVYFCDELHDLFVKHKIKDVEINAHWKSGSLVEFFEILTTNPELIEMLRGVAFTKIGLDALKSLKDYKDYKESFIEIFSDLKKLRYHVKNKTIYLRELFFSKDKAPKSSKELKNKIKNKKKPKKKTNDKKK
ncbi:hypothetical protein RGQ13_00525 [Thalassotalea psychrophila]|uniref:Uncharacterized protein n=1 Tax=Thalassotalea psychrophila TaxID=3065647 RepID=A0ABY9TVF2_9GAMM|nr:hypothetical protein RGQ13_00525 [Colwelliaceae bacterium SQ149]